MSWLYLSLLAGSLAGLALADWRWRLALFYDATTTLKVCAGCVFFFLLWDIAGVSLGIFFVGDSRFLTGLRILPEVPVEELVFLALLSYSGLLAWRRFGR